QKAAQVRGVVKEPDLPKSARRVASLVYWATASNAYDAACSAADLSVEVRIWQKGALSSCDWQAIQADQQKASASLLREIFGNPFRSPQVPLSFDSTNELYRTFQSVYEQPNFARLPEIADRLQSIGFTDDQILNHCRSAIPHFRGCWVVDLFLGKS